MVGNICLAGKNQSKSKMTIKTPKAEALRTRAAKFITEEMLDTLTGIGIFETFAEKEIIPSEIEAQVEEAFRSSWAQHIDTMKRQMGKPGVAEKIGTQHRDYTQIHKNMKYVIVSIILFESESNLTN
jgi:hypothetical protein